MNVFRRLFRIGEAEAHSAIDKLEDPIKLTEQGIRDLKRDLDNSLKALAEVKAMSIRSKNDVHTYKNKAEDYEKKAMLILTKAESGDVSAEDADRLASEALVKKEEASQAMSRTLQEQERFDKSVAQLDASVKKIKSSISKYENELKTLKARVRVSETTMKLNKQMAQIDSSGTVSMLERMKEKVDQDEALAEAYGDIANESKSIDEELDSVIGDSEIKTKASSDLAALKAKLKGNKEG